MASIFIRERSVGDVVILEPDGVPRVGEKVGMRDRVVELIGRGTTRFVVNLKKTRGWGSLFVGEVVSGYRPCQQTFCSMKFVNPPKRLGDILAICKLDSAFEFYETEEAAIESFGAPGEPRVAA